MKTLILCASFACCAVAAPTTLAQNEGHAHADHESESVNKVCPLSNEPIDGETSIEYKGHTIGFCCAGCDDKFLAWDETRRDAFVEASMSQPATDDHAGHDAAQPETKPWTEPYALTTCPVSGEELGAMDDTIVKQYDGREVRFCCKDCIKKFEADKEGYWKKIDAQIVRDQLRYYPATTCVVSGEPLVENGEDIANNFVYGNRLVRLCCKMCERKFKADPTKFIEKLDKAAAEAQRADYPLDTCVVRGGKLGAMGEPAEMVVAGRLVRLCCAMCKPKVMADPAKYIAAIDKAWQAQGKFVPTKPDADHGEHDGLNGEHDDDGGHGG